MSEGVNTSLTHHIDIASASHPHYVNITSIYITSKYSITSTSHVSGSVQAVPVCQESSAEFKGKVGLSVYAYASSAKLHFHVSP